MIRKSHLSKACTDVSLAVAAYRYSFYRERCFKAKEDIDFSGFGIGAVV